MNEELVTGPAYNLIPGNKHMSLVSQEFYVLDNHTIQENITDKLIGQTDEAKLKRANQLLKLLELTSLRNTKARNLSSGQKQRVAIARAIVNQPDIIIADEPTGNLDPVNTYEIIKIIQKINELGTTVLLTTHNKGVVDMVGGRVVTMEKGKIIRDDKHGKYIL